jgi:hypothetical protein
VAEAGLTESIEIVHADASSADLGDADVLFVLLPTTVVGDLLGSLLQRLNPGARVVAHELTPFRPEPMPQLRRVVGCDDAITVAYRWQC